MQSWVVADLGNSRMKWGRGRGQVEEAVALEYDSSTPWHNQAQAWQLDGPTHWIVGSVHPERQRAFVAWLRQRGDTVRTIESFHDIPIGLDVETPETVGLDRLFNALAAKDWRPVGVTGTIIIIGAGTAVTVDVLDAQDRFAGGAILPGLGMAAAALHQFTAQLPRIETPAPCPAFPGRHTRAALEAGVFAAVVGGIEWCCRRLDQAPCAYLLTGGDASVLMPALPWPVHHLPFLTLQGLRLASMGP